MAKGATPVPMDGITMPAMLSTLRALAVHSGYALRELPGSTVGKIRMRPAMGEASRGKRGRDPTG